MFGFLKAASMFLFGGSAVHDETNNKTLDIAKGIGSWIDEQQFTEQEKSEANAANLQTVLKAVELTRDENSTRSVTRRVLAWAIMGVYLFTFILCIGLSLAKINIKDILTLVDIFKLGDLALAVGSFYFLVSIARSRSK